jgi:hypothetical protein
MTDYYKVVFKVSTDRFESACTDMMPHEYVLHYSIGSKTEKKPDTLGIFVFSNLEEAKKFASRIGLSTILVGIGTRSVVQAVFYSDRLNMLRDFYIAKKKGRTLSELWYTAKIRHDRPSTVFLDDFTPHTITPK